MPHDTRSTHGRPSEIVHRHVNRCLDPVLNPLEDELDDSVRWVGTRAEREEADLRRMRRRPNRVTIMPGTVVRVSDNVDVKGVSERLRQPPSFERCLSNWEIDKPHKGKLELDLRIAGNGAGASVRIDSNPTGEYWFGRCVVAELKVYLYPHSTDGKTAQLKYSLDIEVVPEP